MACCERAGCDPHRYDPPTCGELTDLGQPGKGFSPGVIHRRGGVVVVEVKNPDNSFYPTRLEWAPIAEEGHMERKAKKVAPPVDINEHNRRASAPPNPEPEAPEEVILDDLFTVVQIAEQLGVKPRTFRKFLRSKGSGIPRAGQGNKYLIPARTVPSLIEKYKTWSGNHSRRPPGPPRCDECDRDFANAQALAMHLDRASIHKDAR